MAKMVTISSLHNQKVQIGSGIVAVLVLALGIMTFWEHPQIVLEQTKALCQDLKSPNNSPANTSLRGKYLWKSLKRWK